MHKLIRITTIPLSLEKLLDGQLTFMFQYFEVIAVSSDKVQLKDFGKNNEVETFYVRMTREITPFIDLRALLKLYKFFKKENPLIVHTHTPKAGIIGMLAAKMAGVPLRLHTVAGLPLMESRGLKRKILETVERLTYACATRIYPNSFGLCEFILKKKFTSNEKVKVLGNGSSNGIDTSFFDPANFTEEDTEKLRSKLKIPLKDIVFIFVGRLVADKGINELVAAFEALQKEDKNISLLLVGPFEQELNPIKNEVLNQIEKHPKIFTEGYQQDVRPFFAASDVLLFPSYREGFPNVVLQAGAMGLPAIVTDINGCNEIIEDGINGILIPVKNKKALKLAMEEILNRPLNRKAMQQNARKRITAKFERKDFWEILLKEYKTLELNLDL